MCISVCGRYTQFEGAVWQLLCLRLKAHSRKEWRTKLNREGRLTMLKMTVRSCWHMVPGDEKDDRFQAQKKKKKYSRKFENSSKENVSRGVKFTRCSEWNWINYPAFLWACTFNATPPQQIYNQLSSWFYWRKVKKQLESSKTRNSNFINLWMGLQLLWLN